MSINSNNFEVSFSSFQGKTWIMSGIMTILLNSLLFLLLPALMHPSPETEGISKRVDHIQVIRMKKNEPPPRKKKLKPPEPPKERPKEKITTTSPLPTPKLTLPFKLNTRLPTISTDFQLPFSDTIIFDASIQHIVNMQQLDKPLTPLVRIPPVYPIRARRKGVEGWVRVSFEIDKQGHVQMLQILEAKPPGVFERSVMQCIVKWRFRTATVEGIAVRAKMETTIRFELE